MPSMGTNLSKSNCFVVLLTIFDIRSSMPHGTIDYSYKIIFYISKRLLSNKFQLKLIEKLVSIFFSSIAKKLLILFP